jgi:glycosyltransferase involved in cell wall biosynthesis
MNSGIKQTSKLKSLFIVNVDGFFISHRLPIALELLDKGYEVHIACGITNNREYMESLGLIVHPIDIIRSGKNILKEIKVFFQIYKVLIRINPAIAHFVSIKPVIYGGIASRYINISRKVFSISGLGYVFIKQGLKAYLFKAVIKILYKIALSGRNTNIIIQNPDDEVIIKSLTRAPTYLIKGSGVDLNKYTYTYESNKNLRVCMACRLLKDKGVYEYIKAAKLLKKKYSNVEFDLFGDIDPPNPSSISIHDIKKIKAEGVVNINGYTPNITRIFADSHIVVLPSYREGLPKVLMEAAACGRAIVTTDVPGCRDAIISNVTGLLCKVRDPKSLSEMIEKLIEDESLRKKMGQSARNMALKEFDINIVIKKHFDIYSKPN